MDMKKEGGKVSSEELGRKINVIEQAGQKIGMIVEGTSMIIGTIDEVRQSVRIINGVSTSLADNKMMKKLLNSKYMLYAGGALKDSDQLKGFSLVCNYKNALQLHVRAYCKDTQIAETLLAQANMMVAMAKEQMQLTDKNLSVSAKGSILTVSVNLNQQKIMDMVTKAMMSFSPTPSDDGDFPEIEPPPAE